MAFFHRSPTVLLVVWLVAALASRSQGQCDQLLPGGYSFGSYSSISADRDFAFIGKPWGYPPEPGVVHVYERQAGIWTETQILAPGDSSTDDGFGGSVSVHGDFAAVSRSNPGGVFLYQRQGSVWVEHTQIPISKTPISGPVSLWGDKLVIADWASDRISTYVREAQHWVLRDEFAFVDLDGFGGSIALGDHWLVVGTPGSYIIDSYHGSCFASPGQVHAFEWIAAGDFWAGGLVATGGFNDSLGEDVDVDGDRILAGAPRRCAAAGEVRVYRHDGSGWTNEQVLGGHPSGSPFDSDYFGISVGFRDGVALVAAPFATVDGFERVGAAYAYRFDGTQLGSEAEISRAPDHAGWNVALGGGCAFVKTYLSGGLDEGVRAFPVDTLIDATRRSYGAGWPGTNGIPSLSVSDDPAWGASLTMLIQNSRGQTTPGLIMLGLSEAQIATNLGGDLLLVPSLFTLITLPSAGWQLPVIIPSSCSVPGLAVYLQALELDPGASRGVSFTPGLELVLGI